MTDEVGPKPVQYLLPEVQSQLRSGIATPSVVQCVEELVINGIDAGASCIAVRIDLSNYRIQVIDNGKGISFEDLSLIGERYATSKCHDLKDLESLSFFGYRGEALASIRDISSVLEIISRVRGSGVTTRKLFRHGKEVELSKDRTSRPSGGTTVTVHNVFYNMPVRRKMLCCPLVYEKICKRMEAIALIHPNVSLTLKDDGTGAKSIQTHSTLSVVNTFGFLFGRDRANTLKEVSYAHGHFSISGFIGTGSYRSKALQFLYVNGRLVLKTKLHKLINELLGRSLLTRSKTRNLDSVQNCNRQFNSVQCQPSPGGSSCEYGMFVLDIRCPQCEYDITLDPAKTLVEFRDWNAVLICLQELVFAFLIRENMTMKLSPVQIQEGFDQMDNENDSNMHDTEKVPAASLSSCEPYRYAISTSDCKHTVHSTCVRRQMTVTTETKHVFGTNECNSQCDPSSPVSYPVVSCSSPENSQTSSSVSADADQISHDRDCSEYGTFISVHKLRPEPSMRMVLETPMTTDLIIPQIDSCASVLPSVHDQHTHSACSSSSANGDVLCTPHSQRLITEGNDQLAPHHCCIDKERANHCEFVHPIGDSPSSYTHSNQTPPCLQLPLPQKQQSQSRTILYSANKDEHSCNNNTCILEATSGNMVVQEEAREKLTDTSDGSEPNEDDTCQCGDGHVSTSAKTVDETDNLTKISGALAVKMKNSLHSFKRSVKDSSTLKSVNNNAGAHPLQTSYTIPQIGLDSSGSTPIALRWHRSPGFRGRLAKLNVKCIDQVDERKTLLADIFKQSNKLRIVDRNDEISNCKSHGNQNDDCDMTEDELTTNGEPALHSAHAHETSVFHNTTGEIQIDSASEDIDRRPQVTVKPNLCKPRNTSGIERNNAEYFSRPVFQKQQKLGASDYSRKQCYDQTVSTAQSRNFYTMDSFIESAHDVFGNRTEQDALNMPSECPEELTNVKSVSTSDGTVDSLGYKSSSEQRAVMLADDASGRMTGWTAEVNHERGAVTVDVHKAVGHTQLGTDHIKCVDETVTDLDDVQDEAGENVKSTKTASSPVLTAPESPDSHAVQPSGEHGEHLFDLNHSSLLKSSSNLGQHQNNEATTTDDKWDKTMDFTFGDEEQMRSTDHKDVIASTTSYKVLPADDVSEASMSVCTRKQCTSSQMSQGKDFQSKTSDSNSEASSSMSGEKDSLGLLGEDWYCHYDASLGKNVFISRITGNCLMEEPCQDEQRSLHGGQSGHWDKTFTMLTKRDTLAHPHLSHNAAPFVPSLRQRCQDVAGTDHTTTCRSLSPGARAALDAVMVDHRTQEEDSANVKWGNNIRYRDSSETSASNSDWLTPGFDGGNGLDVQTATVSDRTANSDARLHAKLLASLNPCQFTKSMFENIQVLGQVDDKFIACLLNSEHDKNPAGQPNLLVLVDQHAAHERVRLELLTADAYAYDEDDHDDGASSDMRCIQTSFVIPPIPVKLSSSEVRLTTAFRQKLERVGIGFAANDDEGCVLVIRLPTCVVEREANELKRGRQTVATCIVEALIKEQLDLVQRTAGASAALPKTITRILNSQACHGAIKFGDSLDLDECRTLIGQLSACDLPFQCAHGRPSLMPILDLNKTRLKLDVKTVSSGPRLWKLKR